MTVSTSVLLAGGIVLIISAAGYLAYRVYLIWASAEAAASFVRSMQEDANRWQNDLASQARGLPLGWRRCVENLEVEVGSNYSSPGKAYRKERLYLNHLEIRREADRITLRGNGEWRYDEWCWHSMGVSDEDRAMYVRDGQFEKSQRKVVVLRCSFRFDPVGHLQVEKSECGEAHFSDKDLARVLAAAINASACSASPSR